MIKTLNSKNKGYILHLSKFSETGIVEYTFSHNFCLDTTLTFFIILYKFDENIENLKSTIFDYF